ncbi:MAG: alkyl hydroperoxide reductase, partial [Planctomycetaceae bacterium]|nr:alkyl hydroperoxide reductase [Planctomycetaceae bacterium]
RILNQHCVECHRDGEIGPFSLVNYDDVIGWADMILETIDDGRMPPWHANPHHGEFVNARHMPDAEKQTLRDWVAAGAPYGRVDELPVPPSFTDGWQLPREPDLILEMRERPFRVPAAGTVEYQYYVVDPGFEEDTWITGAQVIPGNRAVVHHAIVFIRPPDGAQFRGIGWISAYVPGQRTMLLPSGHARFVPRGSKLVFQMHYTPNGVEAEDVTRIGLLLGQDAEITHEVVTLVGVDQEFEIPPHAADFAVHGRVRRIPTGSTLLAAVPHMHLRGKAFQLFARNDSGDHEVLLDVPHYDFNWQHIYQFQRPLPLDEIEELRFTVRFDNSAGNPANPDPSQSVSWGDQSWEEMALAFFEVAQPRERLEPVSTHSEEELADRQRQIDRFVADFLERFDANQDGHVARDETPLSFSRFGFSRLDQDGDGVLTRSELEDAARRKLKF